MKMDCNITDNFFKELDRMCESYRICAQCGIKEIMETYQMLDCRTLTMEHWEEVKNVVQKWSDEHQPETRLEHFKKMFPKAEMSSSERPMACVKHLNGEFECQISKTSCTFCWNEPYNGEF